MDVRARNAKVLDAMPEGDMMLVAVRKIEELPDGFNLIEAAPGTAAHEYIVDCRETSDHD